MVREVWEVKKIEGLVEMEALEEEGEEEHHVVVEVVELETGMRKESLREMV